MPRCFDCDRCYCGRFLSPRHSVSVLEPLTQVFLRANGYSLDATLGDSVALIEPDGPGSYSGPIVGSAQALAVLVATAAAFAALAARLLRRRDME